MDCWDQHEAELMLDLVMGDSDTDWQEIAGILHKTETECKHFGLLILNELMDSPLPNNSNYKTLLPQLKCIKREQTTGIKPIGTPFQTSSAGLYEQCSVFQTQPGIPTTFMPFSSITTVPQQAIKTLTTTIDPARKPPVKRKPDDMTPTQKLEFIESKKKENNILSAEQIAHQIMIKSIYFEAQFIASSKNMILTPSPTEQSDNQKSVLIEELFELCSCIHKDCNIQTEKSKSLIAFLMQPDNKKKTKNNDEKVFEVVEPVEMVNENKPPNVRSIAQLKRKDWTEMDLQLIEAVRIHGEIKKWNKIALALNNFATPQQCRLHWIDVLKKKVEKRGNHL